MDTNIFDPIQLKATQLPEAGYTLPSLKLPAMPALPTSLEAIQKQNIYKQQVRQANAERMAKFVEYDNQRTQYNEYMAQLKQDQLDSMANYSNMDDPMQMNSMADVVYDTFVGFLRADSIGRRLYYMSGAANLVNTGEVVYRTFYRPLIEGDFTALFTNSLVNLSESLDILANPVKGFVMGGLDGLKKSVGWDGNGRYNYNWDTGSFAKDMVLEMVSDPLNLISFGGSTVLKGASKGVKAALATGLKEAGEEAATKAVTKMVMKGFASGTDDFIEAGLKKLAQPKTMQALGINSLPTAELLKDIVMNNNAYTVLKATGKVKATANAVDDAITKYMISSSLGFAPHIIAKGFKEGKRAIFTLSTRIAEAAKPYTIEGTDIIDLTKMNEALNAINRERNIIQLVDDLKDLDDTVPVPDIIIKNAVKQTEEMLDLAVRTSFGVNGRATNIKIKDNLDKFIQMRFPAYQNFPEFVTAVHSVAPHVAKYGEYDSILMKMDSLVSIYKRGIEDAAATKYASNLKSQLELLDNSHNYLTEKAYNYKLSSLGLPVDINASAVRNELDSVREYMDTFNDNLEAWDDIIDQFDGMPDIQKTLRKIAYSLSGMDEYEYIRFMDLITEPTQTGVKFPIAKLLKRFGTSLDAFKRMYKTYQLKLIKQGINGDKYGAAYIRLLNDDFMNLAESPVLQTHSLGKLLDVFKQSKVADQFSTYTDLLKYLEQYDDAGMYLTRNDVTEIVNTIEVQLSALVSDSNFNKYSSSFETLSRDLDAANLKAPRTTFQLKQQLLELQSIIGNPEVKLGTLVTRTRELLSELRSTTYYYHDLVVNNKHIINTDVLDKLVKMSDTDPVEMLKQAVKDGLVRYQPVTVTNELDYDNIERMFTGAYTTESVVVKGKSKIINYTQFEVMLKELQTAITDTAKKSSINRDVDLFVEVMRDSGELITDHLTKRKVNLNIIYAELTNIMDTYNRMVSTLADASASGVKGVDNVENVFTRYIAGDYVGDKKTVARLQDIIAKSKASVDDLADQLPKMYADVMNGKATRAAYNELRQLHMAEIQRLIRYSDSLAAMRKADAVNHVMPFFKQLEESISNAFEVATTDVPFSAEIYNAKLTQITSLIKLYNVPKVLDLADDVANVRGFASILYDSYNDKNMVELGYNNSARRVLQMLNGIDSYNKFLNDFNTLSFGTDERTSFDVSKAILDTMQGYSTRSADTIFNEFDYYFDKIMRDAQTQVNTIGPKAKQLNLEAMAKKYADDPVWIEIAQKYGYDTVNAANHDAGFDVLLTYFLDTHVLKSIYEEGKRPIYYDIETTGVTGQVDEIYQLSFFDPISGYFERGLKAKTKQRPLDSFLEKAFKTGNAADNRKAYEEFIKDAGSEADLLTTFNRYLNDNYTASSRPVLIGHNSVDFDNTFINKRANILGVKHGFNAHEVADTYIGLQRANDYFMFTPQEIRDVRIKFSNYRNLRDMELFNQLDYAKLIEKQADSSYIPVQKFIETPSKEFTSNLRDVMGYFAKVQDEMGKTRAGTSAGSIIDPMMDAKEAGEMISAYTTLLNRYRDEINNIIDGVSDTLVGIKLTNEELASYYATVDAGMKSTFLEKGVNNIVQALNKDLADIDGLTPFMGVGVKKIGVGEQILDYFRPLLRDDELMPMSTKLAKYSSSVKKFNRLRDRIQRIELLEPYLDDLRDYVVRSRDELLNMNTAVFNNVGKTNNPSVITALVGDPLIRDLNVETDDIRTLFVMAVTLNRKKMNLFKVAPDSMRYLSVAPSTLQEYIQNPNLLKRTRYGQMRSFIEPSFELDGTYYKGWKAYQDILDAEAEWANDIKILEHTNELMQKHGATYMGTQVKMGAMEPIHAAFRRLRKLFEEADEAGHKTYAKQIYTELTTYQDSIGLRQLQDFLNLSPKDMAAHMYHKAKGYVTFSNLDLMDYRIENIPVSSGRDKKFLEILDNIEEYRKFGIEVIQEDFTNDVTFVLRNDVDLSLIQDSVNYGKRFDTYPRYLADEPLFVDEINRVYRTLDHYTNGASKRTAGELFKKDDFINLMNRISPKAKDIGFTLEHFLGEEGFASIGYNFSVLGTMDFKKTKMPYLSINPLKNMAMSMQAELARMDNRFLYANYLESELFSMDHEALKALDNQDLLETVTKGNYRFVKVFEDKTRGVKVKQLLVNNVADIRKAKAEGYYIVPEYVATKIKAIINQGKITNPILRMLDKGLFTPKKIGDLLRVGFLARNAVDSTLKNVVEGGFETLPEMFSTMKIYNDYDNVIKEIQAMPGSKGLINTATVNRYFDGKPRMKRGMFELIHEFITDAPSAGLSAEMAKYYDDLAKQIYTSVAHREDITLDMVRTVLEQTTTEINTTYNPELAAKLLELKADSKYYTKATEILKYTQDQRFTKDKILYYLRKPSAVPFADQEDWAKLLERSKLSGIEEAIDKVVFNPAVRGFMSANTYIEQISRLNLYLNKIRNGVNHNDAVAIVTKAHHDFTHRSTANRVAEMIMPFISFRVKNTLYWGEAVERNALFAKFASDAVREYWNIGQDDEDSMEQQMAFNRSFASMVMAGNLPIKILENQFRDYVRDEDGNIKLNDRGDLRYYTYDIAMTMKLNPSLMDSMNTFTNPKDAAYMGLNAYLKGILKATGIEQTMLDAGIIDNSMPMTPLNLVPYFGNVIPSLQRGQVQGEQVQSVLPKIMPSLFGRTYLNYDMSTPYKTKLKDLGQSTYTPYEDRPVGRNWQYQTEDYKKTHRYIRGLSDIDFDTEGYMSSRTGRRQNVVYATRGLRNIWYRKNRLHKDLFTSNGTSRLKLLHYPVQPKTVQYQVKELWPYLR